MKWDVFSDRKRGKPHNIRDNINDLIKIIEKFAPRKYRNERESFYYNYRLLDDYLDPLFSLLSVISRKQRMGGDKEDLIHDLFLKLKDFYDRRETLTLSEAIQDKNLRKKLGQIFLIFYNKKDMTMGEIETYLERLRTDR